MIFFLSLSVTFFHLKKKSAFSVESPYHKDSNTSRPLNKVKPCSVGLVLGWVTTYEYPCCNKLFFFSFFPIPFQGKPAELQHCVMSFLLHVFIINLLVISPCPYLPVFIYDIIGETLTSNTHRAIISEHWASLLRPGNIQIKASRLNTLQTATWQ